MAIVLAGGAGFIGSHLARHFLAQGRHVLVLDNLCRGRQEYLANCGGNLDFDQIDLADEKATLAAIAACHARHPISEIWHMAANSDILSGMEDPHVDLRDTFLTTFSLLQAMKKLGLGHIAFASSSAVYGEHGADVKIAEDTGPLLPISNYGAMKLASEALISAAAENFLKKAIIFRFPNVVGVPATHGVILDFVRKLKESPELLKVLGNGSQQKIYLHVADLVDAMLFINERAKDRLTVCNIGPDDAGCAVRFIAESVVQAISPAAAIEYGSADRGWVGDVPRFSYSVKRLENMGWTSPRTSSQAVAKAIEEIICQEHGL